jgi:CPA2 family monovalent cation:H+ antiporter-2
MHAEELLIIIAAAALGAALFERFRMPSVVGFLVAGAALGPGGLGLVEDSESVLAIAEFGVAFLLFEIGLELPIDELRRSFRTSLLAGLLQVSITVAVPALLFTAFGLPGETAVIVGMLIALSSTALVMRILAQRGEVDAPHGRLSLGILLFQDLCIVPFLLAVPLLSGEVQRDEITKEVGLAIVKLGGLYAAARFLLPAILARVARLRSGDLFSLFAILVAMGSAVLAEEIGLTLAVGAFIAGLVVSSSPYATQLFAEVAPLRGVLLGVFFTSVGMLLDTAEALTLWDDVLLFVTGVVAFKALVVIAISVLVLRLSMRTAVQTGLGLAQSGEFSFVLAAAAAGAGLMSDELVQVFVAGSILTLVATPFLIGAAPRVAEWLARGEPVPKATGDAELRDHAVIAGWGLAGRTLAGVLRASSIPYRIVDSNPRNVERGRKEGEPITFGDATRPAVLEHLGIRHARLFCVAISDPEATRDAIQVVRALAQDVYVVARTRYARDLDELFGCGANEAVAEEIESSIDLVSKVLRRFDVTSAAVAHFAEKMREEGYELLRGPLGVRIDPWFADILDEMGTEWVEVPAGAPVGRTIEELRIRERTGVMIVGVRHRGTTQTNPDPSTPLHPGDALLVMASGEELRALRELLQSGGA